MLSAGIQIERIVPPFEAQRMKPNGSITLIKMNGVTLLRAPGGEAYFGKSIAQAPDFIEHLAAKPRGMFRVIGAYDGVERLVGHARMKQYPVIVAVTATVDDALAVWLGTQIQAALLVLAITLATLLITYRLLTAERVARERLTRSERRFRKLIEHAPDAILLADAGTQRIIDANPRAAMLFGRSHEDLLSGGIERLYAPQQPDGLSAGECVRIAQERARAGGSVVVERVIRRPSGQQLVAEVRIDDVSEDGRHLVRGSFVDITDRKRAEQALRDNEAQLRALVDTLPLPMLVTSPPPETRVLMVNASFVDVFGYEPADIPSLATAWACSLPDASTRRETIARWNEALEQMHAAGRHSFAQPIPADMHARDGTRRAMEIHFSQQGERCLMVFNDLTAHRIHEEQLARIAHFDTLTGLPNRRLLNDRMERAIARSARSGKMLAVCYLDLDNFKPVNDTHGHEAGDRVLVEAARRMEEPIRIEDTVARLGGDEFVLLLVDLETVTECQGVLRRIIVALAAPFAISEGVSATLSASVGVALFPADSGSADELIRKADQAMYSAKQSGRNRVVFFSGEPVGTPASSPARISPSPQRQ
jgi:diguanylate cyclase (GGDEF)-like protein/PAS domain S-box-containing protein